MVLSYHCMLMMPSCLESPIHQTTVTVQKDVHKVRSWSCANIYTLSKSKCKCHLPHNQHYSLKATPWIKWSSSILVFSIHTAFLGVSMSSQSAVRRGRFLDYCTLKPILQQNSCSALCTPAVIGIISTMPQLSGPSTWRRTNLHLKCPETCMPYAATRSWASSYQDIFNPKFKSLINV